MSTFLWLQRPISGLANLLLSGTIIELWLVHMTAWSPLVRVGSEHDFRTPALAEWRAFTSVLEQVFADVHSTSAIGNHDGAL